MESVANLNPALEPVGWLNRLRVWFRQERTADSAAVPGWAHAVLWLYLLGVDAFVLYAQSLNPKMPAPHWAPWLGRTVVIDVLGAGLFYLNWRILIPRTLGQGRVGRYSLGALLLVSLYELLRFFSNRLLPLQATSPMRGEELPRLLLQYTLAALFLLFLSSALCVTRDYLRAQRHRRELERQQLLTELTALKMQVNPHFLFNTLNNIYSLASQKSDRAPEAVLRLSEIMRYMLYESSADTVPLAKELQHLRSFLELQRLRLPATGPAAIVFDTVGLGESPSWPIAPMLLQPLVENAFKHGDLTARPVVRMRLEQPESGALHFVVDNAVAPAGSRPPAGLEPSGGVGLVNLRRRLELLYPGRHQLVISATPEHYRAVLTLWPG
ncbi:sensor histidine kinase [Hymenobacter sp. CRA2]|uniref:sensor histidine kinase n=1 Tax=Hymenobacter sp. CRA2 TaxID=1955620 RepID=UPI00098EDD6E|nr:sensor histidine kinase [Hymenobacter sp. CRA2]OON70465.1 hypothetical protein B0919_00065 [Hymenobacter sp. CRA2]